jgi:polysaccharide biosynthesis protein VpsM
MRGAFLELTIGKRGPSSPRYALLALWGGLLCAAPQGAFAQTDVGSLPRVSAPGAFGDSVVTGATAGSSTARALAPPPGIGSEASAGLTLNVSIGASRHSNPERRPEGSEADTSFVVSPGITLGGELGRHQYELGYDAGSRRYGDFETRDTDYQRLGGALRLDLGRVLIGDLYASRVESEEVRGTSGARDFLVDEEDDEYQVDTLGGRLTLGRRTNLLQLYVGAETSSIEFTNNNQEFRDRDQDTLEAGLFFNVGPATALFLHARETSFDYLVGNPSIDNTETSFTGGVTWEASEAISLVLEVGDLEKVYDDPAIAGFEGTTYLGKLLWSPRNRTSVSLYTSRTTEESSEAGAVFFVSEVSGIDFSQQVGQRGSISLHYAQSDDEFSNGRLDNVTDYGIGFGYSLFSWMDLGISYNKVDKESSDPRFNFEDEIYSVFVNLKPSIGSDQ